VLDNYRVGVGIRKSDRRRLLYSNHIAGMCSEGGSADKRELKVKVELVVFKRR
jgi:hypothetical protein